MDVEAAPGSTQLKLSTFQAWNWKCDTSNYHVGFRGEKCFPRMIGIDKMTLGTEKPLFMGVNSFASHSISYLFSRDYFFLLTPWKFRALKSPRLIFFCPSKSKLLIKNCQIYSNFSSSKNKLAIKSVKNTKKETNYSGMSYYWLFLGLS